MTRTFVPKRFTSILTTTIRRGIFATTESEPQGRGVVVIHHFPGYDEATKEIVRKFAANGYNASVSTLLSRISRCEFDDAAAAARASVGCRTINCR